MVDPARSDLQNPRRQILVRILEHMVGSRCAREIRLGVAADRRDDDGTRPHGELDGGVPDGARPTLNEHHSVIEGTG